MFFKITTPDDYYYFDNLTTMFYTKDYKKINLRYFNNDPKLNYLNNRIFYDSCTPNYYLNHTNPIDNSDGFNNRKISLDTITWLDLIVGSKCNYRCKYCIQQEHQEQINYDPVKFEDMILKSGIDFSKIALVRIWGGESFVYLDRFKSLIDMLRCRFSYNGVVLAITNGSLFNQNLCSYCLDNNVKVIFSHDGPAQKIYRNVDDYLDNVSCKQAIIRQLKAKQIDYGFSRSGMMFPVIGPINYNLEHTIDWFQSKLYDGVPILIDTLFKADRHNTHLLNDYTEHSIKAVKTNLKKAFLATEDDPYYPYYWRLQKIRDTAARHLLFELPYASYVARCPSHNTQQRLCVDLEGRVIACYADNHTFKHVEGTLDNLPATKYHLNSMQNRHECLNCHIASSCMGQCPWLDSEDHAHRCRSQKPYYEALFESAFELLFKEPIVNVELLDETSTIYSIR